MAINMLKRSAKTAMTTSLSTISMNVRYLSRIAESKSNALLNQSPGISTFKRQLTTIEPKTETLPFIGQQIRKFTSVPKEPKIEKFNLDLTYVKGYKRYNGWWWRAEPYQLLTIHNFIGKCPKDEKFKRYPEVKLQFHKLPIQLKQALIEDWRCYAKQESEFKTQQFIMDRFKYYYNRRQDIFDSPEEYLIAALKVKQMFDLENSLPKIIRKSASEKTKIVSRLGVDWIKLERGRFEENLRKEFQTAFRLKGLQKDGDTFLGEIRANCGFNSEQDTGNTFKYTNLQHCR